MSFRAWGSKQNLVFARSVPATQVNAVTPVGFAGGDGQCSIYNSGAVDVLVAFYKNSEGTPTLVFPVDGSPPVGSGAGAQHASAVVVPKGARIQVSIPAIADSFAAIGQAAGPSIIYVQRGTGSV